MKPASPRPSRKRTAVPSPQLTLTSRQVSAVARTVAKTLEQHTSVIQATNDRVAHTIFDVLIQRFDRVDKDNNEIKENLTTHMVDDNNVHAVVAKHTTYWSILTTSGLGAIAGGFAIFMAWFKSR